MPPDVTVVIGNHQGEQLLPTCLASLRAQTQRPATVIVADGGSIDASIAVAEKEGAEVLRCPNNGLGYLYNRGAEAARTPFVLLLNNDVALEATCLERLAVELARDACHFAADARQQTWDGHGLIHSRTTLSPGPLLHQLLPGFELDLRAPADGVLTTICTNGAAMMVRRDLMLELGGFDETFFLDFEDLDLCWRAWLRGWSSIHVPDAVVRHRVGAATSDDVRLRRLISSHHNLIRFALKCLPPRDAARVVAAELLRVPIHPRLVPPALAVVAHELRDILAQRRTIRPTRRFVSWALAGMPDRGETQ